MEDRTHELKSLATRLDALQHAVSEAEGRQVSDGDFAKRYLTFSATTLSRIRSTDDPYTGNLASIADKVAQAEEEVVERLAEVKLAADSERAFVQTTLARATQASIKQARDSKRRVVVLLAPTGAGKSEVGKMLSSRGAVYIEGKQSWRKSYKAFCADVARAAGRPMKTKYFGEHDAEERMMQALRSRDNTLFIDEANTLSPECVNALKMVVNSSGTVVVIAAVPSAWNTLTAWAEEEVAQLINRCQPILHYRGLSAADTTPFLSHCGLPPADVGPCVQIAMDAANQFGALGTLVFIRDELAKINRPTIEDVRRIVAFHSKNILLSGIAKGVAK